MVGVERGTGHEGHAAVHRLRQQRDGIDALGPVAGAKLGVRIGDPVVPDSVFGTVEKTVFRKADGYLNPATDLLEEGATR